MREILFKAKKYFIRDKNYSVYGSYSWKDYEVISETVSQFTGLTDKNGVKIFENDIMKNKINGVGVVKYGNYAEFMLDFIDDIFCSSFCLAILREYKVIGNVFDKEVK